NYVDFDAKEVIEIVDPSIKPDLSDNQKKSLNNELIKMYSSNTLSSNTKEEIKNWENNLTNDKNSNEPLPRVSPSTYRQQALAYAKKHGYTNGYYGSTNRKNNAPSPYYNFQKDGYGDCANFVSQCLHEAGVTFWTNNNPWYYYSTSNRSPSWAGAREFKIHWVNRIAYQTLTVSNSLSFLRPATPVSILKSSGVATHTLISTDKHSNGYNFSYAAH
ncbi:TPA: amidase domain-containing protein, partial [Clostridioides difficile]